MTSALPQMPPAGRGAGVRSSFDRVVTALESVTGPVVARRPMHVMAHCPLHEDKTPSLAVDWREGHRGGLTLVTCHSCGAPGQDLVEALGLGMPDLFDEPLPPRERGAGARTSRSPQQRLAGRRRGRLGRLPALITTPAGPGDDDGVVAHVWVPVVTYPYADGDGVLVQEVVREQCTACPQPHKSFRQVFVVGDGRRKTKPAGFRPVLYRHAQVLQAVADGRPVWLLEGEKDVETAEACGLVATTNTQGGRAFPAELVQVLAGADVRIVLDRDDAGWDRGVSLHAQLSAVGATVRLLLPVPTGAKADFTDHIEAGHPVEALLDVHVLEVAAWAALGAARRKRAAVEQALSQSELQLAAAHDAGRQVEVVQEHRRLAARWSAESEIRFEALRDLVDDVQRHVVRTGTEWAAQAHLQAVGLLEQGRSAALAAHEAAGADVPPALQGPSDGGSTPVEDGEAPGVGWDRDGGADGRVGAVITGPRYRLVNGKIVQLEPVRNGRGKTATAEEGMEGQDAFKLVLGLDVRIVQMEYLSPQEQHDEDEMPLENRPAADPDNVDEQPSTPQLVTVVVGYTHPVTGEGCLRRIGAEDYPDCRWLESLPGPPVYDSRPAGLAKVRDAIKAVSGPIAQVTRYRSTGWRHTADQWLFFHARASIGAAGEQPERALLSGPLARYDLPSPTQDAGRLREAFCQHSGALLTRTPTRVAAPLLGHTYRSALAPNGWVLALVGSPGSYKTSMASIAMHHWGERWDRNKPCTSLSGNGDTFNNYRLKLNFANNVMFWADDAAPTKSIQAAQEIVESLGRLMYNGEQRGRASRDGQSEVAGTSPRTSALVTSEVRPRAGTGGGARLLVVPMNQHEVDLDVLKAFDRWESRSARALLMASLLQHLAADLPGRRARGRQHAQELAARLVASGVGERPAEATGETWAGWNAMIEFLCEVGALSQIEGQQVLDLAQAGLWEAADAAADPDVPMTTGARVRELLVHALQTGAAYVQDVHTGQDPAWPLAGRLGWKRTVRFVDTDGTTHYQSDARGVPFGFLLDEAGLPDGPQLLTTTAALEHVLKQAGSAMTDSQQLDARTAMTALLYEGILIPEKRAGKSPRLTVQRTVHCESKRRGRMVALRLDALLGDEPDGDVVDDGPDAGTPDPDMNVLDGLDGSGPVGSPCGGLFNLPTVVDGSQQAGVGSPAPQRGLTSPTAEGPAMNAAVADRTSAPAGPDLPSVPAVHPRAPADTPAADTPRPDTARPDTPRPDTAGENVLHPPTRQRPVEAPDAPGVPLTGTARPGAGSTASRPQPGTFVAPAAVVDTDGVWLPDGSCRPLPERFRHVGDLAELVPQLRLGTQVTDYRVEPGQLWVTAAMLTRLGVDADRIPADPAKRVEAVRELSRGSELVELARAEGWRVGGPGDCLSGWTRVWRDDQQGRGVWIALVPAMNTDPGEVPVLGQDPTPAVLARRLALFAGALRAPWALSAASTGIDLMISLRAKERERLFTPYEPVPPARINTLEQDLDWSRVPSQAEQQAFLYVHAYDRGGSYAAGVAGLEVGIGAAEHYPQGRAFDRKLPGYWKVQVPASGDWRMPHPLNPRGAVPQRPVWVSSPTLQLACELGHEPAVLEAYVWPEHGRVLDPWYARVRDARTRLDVADPDAQAARELLKVVYTRTIGMLGSTEWMRGRPGFAPDRRHHIVAKSRANILRRVVQIGQDSGRWPVAVLADTVLYLSDSMDPDASWPGKPANYGRGFGQFKAEAWGLLEEQLPHLTGQGWRGKDQLDGVV